MTITQPKERSEGSALACQLVAYQLRDQGAMGREKQRRVSVALAVQLSGDWSTKTLGRKKRGRKKRTVTYLLNIHQK